VIREVPSIVLESFLFFVLPRGLPLRWQNPKLKDAWQRGTPAHRRLTYLFRFVCLPTTSRRLLLPPSQDPKNIIIPRTTKHPTTLLCCGHIPPPCHTALSAQSHSSLSRQRQDTACNPSQKYPSTVLYMTMPNTLLPTTTLHL
jgi:hypothetical protein